MYPERGISYISLLHHRHGMTSPRLRGACQSVRFIWKLVHLVSDSPSLISSLNFRVPHFTSHFLTSFCLSVFLSLDLTCSPPYLLLQCVVLLTFIIMIFRWFHSRDVELFIYFLTNLCMYTIYTY